MRRLFLLLLFLLAQFPAERGACAQKTPPPQAPETSAEERALLHAGRDWQLIAPHLANPTTASATDLETDADVLRARRFPEDALDYYGYALARGGDVTRLLKKMGIVRLELQQYPLARALFLRCVRARKKDGEAWNDLAATDYVTGDYANSIREYKRALRLDPRSAIMHENLGMAYLEDKDAESANQQFALALRLDPTVMERRNNGGTVAHVVNVRDYGAFCFELATLYAKQHKTELMRLWLTKASERGFDVRTGMGSRPEFMPWLQDKAILQMLRSNEDMQKHSLAQDVPSLGPAAPPEE